MPIVKYEANLHSSRVARLFAAIYPQWPQAECRRMAYDENQPRHRATLLAMRHETPVGQINAFSLDPDHRLGNIGYHVHPDWQRKGVGSLLLKKAGILIEGHFEDGVVVQTTADNAGSIGLALKVGFIQASIALLDRYGDWLKASRMDRGICLHLPTKGNLSWGALERKAQRAAKALDG